MIGEGSAIRKYKNKLPEELSKRYGGSGPYSLGQVETTVNDLRLSQKHIKFAYLMFCDKKELDSSYFTDTVVAKMLSIVSVSVGGGIVAGPMEGIFGVSGDGGGIGDGGGGGE